jgi:hypothetical protein
MASRSVEAIRESLDNHQRNYDSPTQTTGDVDLTLGGKLRVEQQRHKKNQGK